MIPYKVQSGSKPPVNGPVLVLCQILREVCSSASEAELAALFHNGKETAVLRNVLEDLGHPQAPTTLVTDNSTAAGIANDTVKQRRSKAMDMRYYWVRDRVRQGQFEVKWHPGKTNLADYPTKHHPPTHHRQIRQQFMVNQPHPVLHNYYVSILLSIEASS